MERITEVHILMGLPGSGKTYFGKDLLQTFNYEQSTSAYLLDLDKFVVDEDDKTRDLNITISRALKDTGHETGGYSYFHYNKKFAFIVDGLILTKEHLNTVIEYCFEYLTKNKKYSYQDIKFIIHYWNENRDNCLHNDSLRIKFNERLSPSTTTIKHSVLDKITNDDIDSLNTKFEDLGKVRFVLTKHEVPKLTVYEVVMQPQVSYNGNGKYLHSERWSAGGTYGNCWDDNLSTISPDPTPSTFKEFDELMTKLCPNITFLQYKKLYGETVKIMDDSEHDYYGGCEYYHYFQCDLKKLYELMVEMNLVE